MCVFYSHIQQPVPRCRYLMLRPPHTLRFDLRLACAVSKRKVRWSVCGIKTTDLGLGYTRDWLPKYSFVLRARARRDTTRQECFVVIPAHTAVKIVYCGTVVPSCSSQMSARTVQNNTRDTSRVYVLALRT